MQNPFNWCLAMYLYMPHHCSSKFQHKYWYYQSIGLVYWAFFWWSAWQGLERSQLTFPLEFGIVPLCLVKQLVSLDYQSSWTAFNIIMSQWRWSVITIDRVDRYAYKAKDWSLSITIFHCCDIYFPCMWSNMMSLYKHWYTHTHTYIHMYKLYIYINTRVF